jgi:hypothetical protein
MSRLVVFPIVEGHGEVESIRILVTRIWTELLHQDYVVVARPLRIPRSKITKSAEIRRAVELGRRKLQSELTDRRLVLVLFDADNDLPCKIAPEVRLLLPDPGIYVSIVVANLEYETWFVGAAESLSDFIDVPAHVPDAPETERCRKGRIEQRTKSGRYSETIDQPRFTARMDLIACRRRCPSFDKLCRELSAYTA